MLTYDLLEILDEGGSAFSLEDRAGDEVIAADLTLRGVCKKPWLLSGQLFLVLRIVGPETERVSALDTLQLLKSLSWTKYMSLILLKCLISFITFKMSSASTLWDPLNSENL